MDPNWEIQFIRSPSRWFRAEGHAQFTANTAGKYSVGCLFVLLRCTSPQGFAGLKYPW